MRGHPAVLCYLELLKPYKVQRWKISFQNIVNVSGMR